MLGARLDRHCQTELLKRLRGVSCGKNHRLPMLLVTVTVGEVQLRTPKTVSLDTN